MTGQRHIEDFDGFVLRLFDDTEIREGERHIAECESCRSGMVQAEATAHSFLSLVPPIEPRECLEERVMAAFTAAVEQQRLDAIGPVRVPAQEPTREPFWRKMFAPAPALAFALVLAVAGLLTWGVSTNNRLSEREDTLARNQAVVDAVSRGGRAVALAPQSSDVAGSAVLIIPPSGRPSFLMQGAKTPADDRVYEIWLLKDGTPTPAGTFRPGDNTTIVDVSLDTADYDLVAITEEPAGGSPLPTGAVLMAGEITTS